MTQKGRAKGPQDTRLGLPETLRLIGSEKRVITIAAKVEPSLAAYLKQHGGSTLIHTLILQSLYAITEPQ